MELPTLLRPQCDSDHGRCTHQNGKFLLHWPSVCFFRQCISSLQLSLPSSLPQTHRHSLVTQTTTLTFPLSNTIHAHTFSAVLTCLHLCSPLHRLILASTPRQGAREGNTRNIRLSQTFSISNTRNHTEELTQKRSQSNPSVWLSQNIPLSLSHLAIIHKSPLCSMTEWYIQTLTS